jgi:maltose O-acetyltransferase
MLTGKNLNTNKLTELEKMIAGEHYNARDSEIGAGRMRARKLVKKFNSSEPDDFQERKKILTELFQKSYDRVFIEAPFTCDYGNNITFGEGVLVNYNGIFLDCAKITIGSRVLLGPNVNLYTATHPTDPLERMEYSYAKPITIEDDVWIGGNSTICPGVTIGCGVTVAAGSVVTKDVKPFTIVGGNPARVIKEIGSYEKYLELKKSGQLFNQS